MTRLIRPAPRSTPVMETMPANRTWLKLVLALGTIGLLAIAATHLPIQDNLRQALVWVQSLGAVGPIVFMLLYILSTVVSLPGSVLTLGGGAIFGVLLGTVYVFFAATVGAILAFLIGRYWLRSWVSQRLESSPKFRAIDRAIAEEGFKIVLLTRLSPIFPFSLLNYALSITQVSLRDYALGSIGILPGTVLYVYLGALAGNLATIDPAAGSNPQVQTIQWSFRLVGLVVTVLATLYITRLARKALEQLEQSPPSGD